MLALGKMVLFFRSMSVNAYVYSNCNILIITNGECHADRAVLQCTPVSRQRDEAISPDRSALGFTAGSQTEPTATFSSLSRSS